MKTTTRFASLFAALVSISFSDRVWSDTFGSGANTFIIDFVNIGNPGNAADTSGNPNPAGTVLDPYRIGKFEISEQMIDKANTLGGLLITKNTRGLDKPATSVSWNEAARFVNWLNTSSGSAPAYKFALQPGEVDYIANANIELWTISDAGYNPNNLYRNSLAHYFLPSVDEWYKAAYYDPTSGVYYNYQTGSDSAPTPVASGTALGTAVYNGQFGPADIMLAGGLSPYGTMAQGGNVYEWEETDFDLVNGPSSSTRGVRGGNWVYFSNELWSSTRSDSFNAGTGGPNVGFRVASIPGPVDIGDFNHDGEVDAADYVVWRKNPGGFPAGAYATWRSHFGQTAGSGSGASANAAVPEPTMLTLMILAAVGWTLGRRQTAKSLKTHYA